MQLNTDYAQPYELSVAARVSAEERDRANSSLGQFLPAETVMGTSIRLVEGDNGLVEVAEYRAFDAETGFGSTPGGRTQTVELPPLGQQARVSEYDQLMERNISRPELIKNSLGKVSVRLGRAVADRIEMARGEVIQNGGIEINEGGFVATIDYGRDESMSVVAPTLWSDPTAEVITHLQDWIQEYVDLNGEKPAYIVGSSAALGALKGSDQVRSAATGGQVSQFVTTQFVNDFLAAEGIPQIVEYNRKVRKGGILQDVIDPSILSLVPSGESRSGSTAWGTTLESLHPDYAIVPGEEAGIVVGAYQSHNPMGMYANSAAIGLPVLHEPNKFMAATVL